MAIKHLIISTSFALLSIVPINTFADSDTENDTYSQCAEEYDTINNGVVEACSNAASDELKKEMNRLYAVIYKKMAENSIGDAKAFEQSQMAWLKYRQTHCPLTGSYIGSPMYAFCPMELNRTRVLQLRELAGE